MTVISSPIDMEKTSYEKAGMNENIAGDADQYLTFSIAGETFALDIDQAREVVDGTDVTEVPGMPEYLPGVFNLRGGIVSVIDLCGMLGVANGKAGGDGCVIVMEVEVDGETVAIGVRVDEVRGVVRFGPEGILPAPGIGTQINKDFIRGVGKREDEFMLILDIQKVMAFIESEIRNGSCG